MTKKPSRTTLNLKNTPPNSVRRVFSFINILLNRYRLSPDYFKDKITSFNPIEQYFICQYCQFYFNNKGLGVYLYKWLEEKYRLYDDNGESELYDKLDKSIYQNQEKLLGVLPFIKKTAEKRAKNLLRLDIPRINYLGLHGTTLISSKL